MSRPCWPIEDVAELALRCLRHPPDARLLAQVEALVDEGRAEDASDEAGSEDEATRRYGWAVLAADAATLAAGRW